MKNYIRFSLIYVSILSIVLTILFNQFPLRVYADVPDTQKAVARSSSWGSLNWPYRHYNKYWSITDATGVPVTTNINNPYLFYTNDNIKFFALSGNEIVARVMLAPIGIVLEPDQLSIFTKAFFTAISTKVNNFGYIANGVYDSQNNLLGIALNDISGCYYEGIPQGENPNVTIPKDTINNIYNYYQYEQSQQVSYPDYITVIPPDASFIKANMQDFTEGQNNYNSEVYSNLDTFTQNNDNLAILGFAYSTNDVGSMPYQTFYNAYNSLWPSVLPLNDYHYIQQSPVVGTPSNWNGFCEDYGLINGKNSLNYIDAWNKGMQAANRSIYFAVYNSNNEQITNFQRNTLRNEGESASAYTYNQFTLGRSGQNNGRYFFSMFGGKPYTIYKNVESYNAINVDKDYQKPVYYTNNYYDYSINNTKDIVVTYNTLNQSTTNNQTIYNDCDENFYDNTDNSVVDNSTIVNETTTIVNNYYPIVSDDPQGPEDPDNPSDPDNPIDPDNPSGILDAILDALGRFFKAIGKILATILAGLLEVVDTVLEAIAGIMENFTGVTSFISALFSWLPEPVPQVLAAALSVAILFALIRFIRG